MGHGGDHGARIRRGLGHNLHRVGIGQALQEGNPKLEDGRLVGNHGEAGLLGGGHVHLRPPCADGGDGLHNQRHGPLLLGEAELRAVLRPLLKHEVLPLVGEGLPDLLGDKGHEGVEELEHLGEDVAQDLLGLDLGRLIPALEA